MSVIYDERGGYTPEFVYFMLNVIQPEIELIARRAVTHVKSRGGGWMDGRHIDGVLKITLQREMEKQLDLWWQEKENRRDKNGVLLRRGDWVMYQTQRCRIVEFDTNGLACLTKPGVWADRWVNVAELEISEGNEGKS